MGGGDDGAQGYPFSAYSLYSPQDPSALRQPQPSAFVTRKEYHAVITMDIHPNLNGWPAGGENRAVGWKEKR